MPDSPASRAASNSSLQRARGNAWISSPSGGDSRPCMIAIRGTSGATRVEQKVAELADGAAAARRREDEVRDRPRGRVRVSRRHRKPGELQAAEVVDVVPEVDDVRG